MGPVWRSVRISVWLDYNIYRNIEMMRLRSKQTEAAPHGFLIQSMENLRHEDELR